MWNSGSSEERRTKRHEYTSRRQVGGSQHGRSAAVVMPELPELDETGKLVAGAAGLVLALGLAVLVYKLTRPKCVPRDKCPQLDPCRRRWVHKDVCDHDEPRCIPHVLKPLEPLKPHKR